MSLKQSLEHLSIKKLKGVRNVHLFDFLKQFIFLIEEMT